MQQLSTCHSNYHFSATTPVKPVSIFQTNATPIDVNKAENILQYEWATMIFEAALLLPFYCISTVILNFLGSH
jgi:hypothetical protein